MMNYTTSGKLSNNSSYIISSSTDIMNDIATTWLTKFHNNITGLFDGMTPTIDNIMNMNNNAELYKEIWEKLLVARYKSIVSEFIPKYNTYLDVNSFTSRLVNIDDWLCKFIFLQNSLVANSDYYIAFTIGFYSDDNDNLVPKYNIKWNISAILTKINNDILLPDYDKSYKDFDEIIKIMNIYRSDVKLIETTIIPVIQEYLVNDIKDFFNVILNLQNRKEIKDDNQENLL